MIIILRVYRLDLEHRDRIARNLVNAKTVQETLMPVDTKFPGIELDSYYQPAEETGGDWFDFHYDERSQRFFVFLADVTGHGFPAALLTGVTCGSVKSQLIHLVEQEESTEFILSNLASNLNKTILSTGSQSGHMATVAFAAIHLEANELYFLNGAHPESFLIRNNKHITLVQKSHPVGIKEDADFKVQKYQLDPEDILFLYTDGLVENKGPDGKVLKKSRMARLLPKFKKSPQDFKSELLDHANSIWLEESPEDDCTFLVIKFYGLSQPT